MSEARISEVMPSQFLCALRGGEVAGAALDGRVASAVWRERERG